MKGFQGLVKKEWLAQGHKFGVRLQSKTFSKGNDSVRFGERMMMMAMVVIVMMTVVIVMMAVVATMADLRKSRLRIDREFLDSF